MSGPSNIASIIEASAAVSWVKLAPNKPLAQFHTKFWGTSMKDERDAWSKADGQGALKELAMDVDDDGEAEILPGCYSLGIGIKGFTREFIWVRAEYIRIFDACQRQYEETITPTPGCYFSQEPPSFVITGRPGIGKTLWQIYAARRCASEKRPFLWLYKDRYTLFVEEGAYTLPTSWEHDDFLPGSRVWVFIDSESDPGALTMLTSVGTEFVVFFTTSPSEQRWHKLHKTTSYHLLIMNPWSIGEMKQAASLYNLSEEEVVEKCHRLGPIPRLCIQYTTLQLEAHETKFETALAKLNISTLEKLISESGALAMNETSHSLCLLSREGDRFHKPVLAPVSLYVKTRLANQFRKEELKEKIRLYRHFGKVPQSRSVAGVFFEAAVQSHLTTEISLTLHPMVKRECNGPKLPQWYSSHIPLSNPELEQLRVQAVEEDLSVTPTQTIEYLESELDTILSDVFYVPQRSNQVAIDSFILSNGKLYLFQFTIAKNHPIQSGIINYAAKHGFPKQEDWCFVFIIPPALTLTVPQQPAVKEVCLYTAVVDVTKMF
ncbi:hypothetical protein BU17DRAFT_86251 [Hysterangium stoloniferum]|nr:hypothetical protein BU17DRAFT_86251 [Hysterangium stoloniferum]